MKAHLLPISRAYTYALPRVKCRKYTRLGRAHEFISAPVRYPSRTAQLTGAISGANATSALRHPAGPCEVGAAIKTPSPRHGHRRCGRRPAVGRLCFRHLERHSRQTGADSVDTTATNKSLPGGRQREVEASSARSNFRLEFVTSAFLLRNQMRNRYTSDTTLNTPCTACRLRSRLCLLKRFVGWLVSLCVTSSPVAGPGKKKYIYIANQK